MRRTVLCTLAVLASGALAQQQSTEELARKLADPAALLISAPFQYNYQGDVGPDDKFHNHLLKIQPVIPFKTANGKFILRPIVELLDTQFSEDKTGTGDLFVQGYYIPEREGNFEFGYGPALLLDTASEDSLGTGRNSLGPALVGVYKTPDKKWTIGALANHVWSVDGHDTRDDVSLTNLQPFITRNLPNAWTLSFTSETSYNWEAESGNAWMVPFGGTVSKMLQLGRQSVSIGLGGFYNIERPQFANRWTARLQVTLVIPE